MSKAHKICTVEELPPGERRIVDLDGRSIGVFNIDGQYHAIRNVCPHQRAPLCKGTISGTTLSGAVGEFNYGHEGCIIRCPWHGWEFDITTGRSVFNPHKMRVKSYQVAVEPGNGNGSEAGDENTAKPAMRTVSADEPDPSLEKFDVKVEDRWVVVYT